MDKKDKIFIAGHRGMVGAALLRQLEDRGCHNLITRTHAQLDLTDQRAVRNFFSEEDIDIVLLAAAKVGGIHANDTYRAEFIYQNLMIQSNVIHGAFEAGVRRLLFLGSSCIYPKQCPQPMKEEHLLSGYLEPTNEPYAIAKIAGINMCDSYNRQYGTQYRAVMPTNLYGPNDNYDLENSHVLPAMIRKFHLAKLAHLKDMAAIEKDESINGILPEDVRRALYNDPPIVRLWGSGNARREFLHADDMAAACLFVMQLPDDQYRHMRRASAEFKDTGIDLVSFVNIGSGEEISIRRLAETIARVVSFEGDISWDSTKPDGMMRKLLDTTRLTQMGCRPRFDLETGIRETYRAYLGRL